MEDPPTSQRGPRNKPPSLLACIACRKQHLKCDGRKSRCARCTDKNLECVWIESRRGYRDYRASKVANGRTEIPRPSQAEHVSSNSLGQPTTGYSRGLYVLDPGVAAGQSYTYDELFQPILDDSTSTNNLDASSSATASSPSTTPSPRPSTLTTTGHRDLAPARHGNKNTVQAKDPVDLMEVYYTYFHPAHPFVVPWKLGAREPSLLPDHLKAAMYFIASHYTPTSNKIASEHAAAAIFASSLPRDGFSVQALILYCISCFACSEQTLGAVALDKAIQMAVDLGMNRHTYATIHAPADPTLQETWRRTWWTLFSMDGLITAIGGQTQSFRLHSVFCDVPLPGEDLDYNNLYSSPNPPSLASFRDRTFLEDSQSYSSMAYAVEAMYIMGNIFALKPDTFALTDPQVEAIDTSISNFILSLPPSKREVLEIDGRVDESLLFAHMIINWSSILLHRPRSTLTFIRNHYATVCTKREPTGMPALAYASHTSKTLRAANAIVSLASIHRPLTYCTPCLMCGIATAATVHLPAYAIAEDHNQAMAIKERLQLGISALGRFAEMWSRAGLAKSQIAGFAREVLTKPNVSVDCSSGMGMPILKSSNELESLQVPGDLQQQLEYGMGMSDDDQWMQNIIQGEVDENGDLVGASRSAQDTIDGYTIPT